MATSGSNFGYRIGKMFGDYLTLSYESSYGHIGVYCNEPDKVKITMSKNSPFRLFERKNFMISLKPISETNSDFSDIKIGKYKLKIDEITTVDTEKTKSGQLPTYKEAEIGNPFQYFIGSADITPRMNEKIIAESSHLLEELHKSMSGFEMDLNNGDRKYSDTMADFLSNFGINVTVKK